MRRTGSQIPGNPCPFDVGEDATRPPHEAIARLASRQDGVVARAQLLALGIPGPTVDNRVRRGHLEILRRGLYAVGPIRGPRWREWAAVLAGGRGAAVSHRSAAYLWGLVHARPAGPVEVSVPPPRHPRGPEPRIHRATLPRNERTTLDGIPVTTVARTLLDLAAGPDSRPLERMVARAERQRLLDRADVSRVLDRHPGRAGTPTLRRILAHGGEPAFLRSEAEARFLALVRAARLDPPEANALVRGLEVDFLWRGPGLVVEIDGFAHHASRSAFESDRARDGTLAAAGLRVMRVTWRQLTARPEAVLVRVAQALVVGGGGPG